MEDQDFVFEEDGDSGHGSGKDDLCEAGNYSMDYVIISIVRVLLIFLPWKIVGRCQNRQWVVKLIGMTRLLLENGADVHKGDNDAETLLGAASRSGAIEVVQVLLDKGAVANSSTMAVASESGNIHDETQKTDMQCFESGGRQGKR
ncbi:hypothetical protein MMC22_003919 [Lobaria immixta]|nr:hypothetical protein [Lobaria immixta]